MPDMKPGDMVRATSIVHNSKDFRSLQLHQVGVIVEFETCFPASGDNNIWVHVMIDGEVNSFPISRVHPLLKSENQLQWFGKS